MIARSELNGHLVLCIIALCFRCCENKNLPFVGKEVVRVGRVSDDDSSVIVISKIQVEKKR